MRYRAGRLGRMRYSVGPFGSEVPIATAVPEGQPLSNEKCVTLFAQAEDEHLWIERELHRWEGHTRHHGGSVWKDHLWFKPKLVDGEWSLDFEERTKRGEVGHLRMLKDLEKDLKRLVEAYRSAPSDDECRRIRRRNENVYQAIQFIRHDYEEHVRHALDDWQADLNRRGVDYAEPDGLNYDEGQELTAAEEHHNERQGQGHREGRGRDEYERRWREEQGRRAQLGLGPTNQLFDPLTGTSIISGGRRRPRPRTRRKQRPRRRTRAKRRARSRSRSRPTRRRRRR